MLRHALRAALPLAALLFGLSLLVGPATLAAEEKKKGEEKDEMVENPYYKGWANFKPGATVTHEEKIKYAADVPDGKFHPDGVEHRKIVYKLVEVTPEKAVVETVVTDYEFLSHIQAAATHISYPAKIKKAYLERAMKVLNVKEGDEEIKAMGKSFKCHFYERTGMSEGVTTVRKVWVSPEVPGGVVRDHRVSKNDKEVLSESVTEVLSFKP
jgi:hypothetical protein